MKSTFKALVWRRSQRRLITAVNFEQARLYVGGRHADNDWHIADHTLAQFHFKVRASENSLEILTLPGAAALRRIRRCGGVWIPGRIMAATVTLRERTAWFLHGDLLFAFVPPGEIIQTPWRTATTAGVAKGRRLIAAFGMIILVVLATALTQSPPTPSPEKPAVSAAPAPVRYPIAKEPPEQVVVATPPPYPAQPRPVRAPELFDRERALFARGEEKAALAALIARHEKSPFSPAGIAAAALAKHLNEVMRRRTLAQAFYRRGERAKAFQEWRFVTATSSRDPQALRGFEDLAQDAEKSFRQAYMLESLDPAQAQRIRSEILTYLQPSHPLAVKIRDKIKGPAAEKRTALGRREPDLVPQISSTP